MKFVVLTPAKKTSADNVVIKSLSSLTKGDGNQVEVVTLDTRTVMGFTKWCMGFNGRNSPMRLYRDAHVGDFQC